MPRLTLAPLPRNATPGEVVRFVARYGQLDPKKLGRVDRLGNAASVDVPPKEAARLAAALDGQPFRDRPVRVTLDRLPEHLAGGAGHYEHLSRLLDLEAKAEEEQLRRRAAAGAGGVEGTTLLGLTVVADDTGLGGRLLVTLAKGAKREPLPANRLGPGSPVLLTVRETGRSRPPAWRGVVSDRADRTLEVALDMPDDWPDDALWRVDLAPDDVSRTRQKGALVRVAAASGDRLARLRDVAGGEEPLFAPVEAYRAPHLNDSQNDAVAFALGAADFAVIHGPPGTGKTTTLVELIRQAVARGDRVLACAPSNAAVDNLLEKLLAVGLEPVRIGHPARVAEELRGRALDLLVQREPDARAARKLAREARALFRKADKWTKEKPLPGEKNALRNEARAMLADARTLERRAVDAVLDGAAVLCATLTGVDGDTVGRRRFDLAVLDEAGQSTEPASWLPLLRADRCVLAGDPCQLPPTVVSPEAADAGLDESLLERVLARHGGAASRLLTVQYRMHDAILAFSNAEFYGGALESSPEVVGHTLDGLPGVSPGRLTSSPVRFVDTAGAGYDEGAEEGTSSRANPQEAALAAKLVRELLDAGVPPAGIAVIAPYAGQVRLLRDLLRGSGVDVDSVDGFQGQEREAVVLSFVRSNPEGEVGFLGDVRRTNVALTRARRLLLAVGDSATLANHPFYARLLEYWEGVGAYSSVWEE